MDTLWIINVITCVAAFGAVVVLIKRARRDIAEEDRVKQSIVDHRASCDLAGSAHTYR